MRTKLSKPDNYLFFKDSVLGLVFAGEGAFLHEDNFPIMLGPNVGLALVEDLIVEEGVFVTFIYCDHEHNFYVPQPEDIPKLLKAMHPGRECSIVVAPEYYDYLMGIKHQANLDSWARNPDRMGS